jgi:queuine tRNA-ribosyltransferase
MFDCVLPTRSGRTGQAFTWRGVVNLRNARHAADPRPLDPDCGCPCCHGYSRAYLHHVVRAGEIIASMLLTWHNLHYYQELMAGLRGAIGEGQLEAFVAAFHAQRAEGDMEPM